MRLTLHYLGRYPHLNNDERLSANGGGRSEGRSPGAAGYIRGSAPNKMEKACEASVSPPARCPGSAGHDEGAPARERLVKCGQVVLYRTFLEDLGKVYLSGLQVIGA